MKSKTAFRILAIVFFIALAVVGWDMGRRTTFPGSKPQLQERIKKQFLQQDSVSIDSANTIRR